MIGIETEYTCNTCGALMVTKQILIQSGRTYKFNTPHRCACGNTSKFELLSFKPLQVELYSEDETVLTVPNTIRKEVSTFANDKIKALLTPKTEEKQL